MEVLFFKEQGQKRVKVNYWLDKCPEGVQSLVTKSKGDNYLLSPFISNLIAKLFGIVH